MKDYRDCKCTLCSKQLVTNQQIGDARLKNPKRLLCAQLFLSGFGYRDKALELNKYSFLCKNCAVIQRPNMIPRYVSIFNSELLLELFEDSLLKKQIVLKD